MKSKGFEKQIVMVRHAHRDTSERESDNGLSQKGLEQVGTLVKAYRSGDLPKGRYFFSSPKKRCQETLKPLSELARAPFEIANSLDEKQGSETENQFLHRIDDYLTEIKKLCDKDSVIYICSHGDLIPVAIDLLTGRYVEVEKGKAVRLIYYGRHWTLL